MRINKLKQDKIEAAAAYETLLDAHVKAADGKRLFDEAELRAQADAKAKIAILDQNIAAEQERIDLEKARVTNGATPRIEVKQVAERDPKRGFATHRDFLLSVISASGATDRSAIRDERLKPLAVFDKEDNQAGGEFAFLLPVAFTPASMRAAAGSDEQGEYDSRFGGIAVPSTRLPGVMQIGFEGDPTLGRTQPLPMQTPSVEIMARVDKDHSSSVSGGLTVSRKPETVAKDSARMQLEMITMKAAGLGGISFVSKELLTDSPISFAAILDAGYRTQFGAHILNEKINGRGGNEYLGILTALATTSPGNTGPTISIAKETGQAAATVNYLNTIKMLARVWGLGDAIWLANPTLRPQLMQLSVAVGVAGTLVYQPSPNVGFPDRLHGVPVFYTEYCKTAGTVGDLILANFSQFLEGVYQPIQSEESAHVRFDRREHTFLWWTRNCGAPWWKSPLTPANGDTLSPFVVLATRA